MNDGNANAFLVCRVQARLVALPLAQVVETMRPLPVEVIAGAPPFVLGLAVIRGAPLPVIDTARLLGATDPQACRFVTIAVGVRQIALSVGSVLGVRSLSADALHGLPPVLQEAGAEQIASIGLLDNEFLVVLRSTLLLPDEAWAGIAPVGAAS